MKIVLAPDSFKGSLPAEGVCDALQSGLRRVLPDAEIVRRPMADGGEGTLFVAGHQSDQVVALPCSVGTKEGICVAIKD